MPLDKKIFIVDDEVLIAEHLKDCISSFGYTNIIIAHNKEDALEAIEKQKPQLVLLDIRMKGEKDGIEIGTQLNEKYGIPFIYITAHSDITMLKEALETKPQGYITKPFKRADVFASLNLSFNSLSRIEKSFIAIKDGFDMVRLNLEDIQFVKSDGNYITIYTEKKRYLIRYSMEWILKLLPENLFLRIHRSYIINLNKIERVTNKYVIVGKQIIPVSRKNLKALRDYL